MITEARPAMFQSLESSTLTCGMPADSRDGSNFPLAVFCPIIVPKVLINREYYEMHLNVRKTPQPSTQSILKETLYGLDQT